MGRRHAILVRTRRWQHVRRAVFERDGFRCCACGLPGKLECDHVAPLQREPGQDPWDINGLQTLCRACHLEKTRRENRRETTPGADRWRKLMAEGLNHQ